MEVSEKKEHGRSDDPECKNAAWPWSFPSRGGDTKRRLHTLPPHPGRGQNGIGWDLSGVWLSYSSNCWQDLYLYPNALGCDMGYFHFVDQLHVFVLWVVGSNGASIDRKWALHSGANFRMGQTHLRRSLPLYDERRTKHGTGTGRQLWHHSGQVNNSKAQQGPSHPPPLTLTGSSVTEPAWVGIRNEFRQHRNMGKPWTKTWVSEFHLFFKEIVWQLCSLVSRLRSVPPCQCLAEKNACDILCQVEGLDIL